MRNRIEIFAGDAAELNGPRSETANLLMVWTRRRLADRIVYQSRFVEQWWDGEHGPAHLNFTLPTC